MTSVQAPQSVANNPSSESTPLPNPMEVLSAIAQSNSSGGTSSPPPSNVIISPFGELLVGLIQLQMQNAAYFKEVAAQAASRVQEAAQQQANTENQQFLNSFANSLQAASQTGELTTLPTPPVTSALAYSRSGQAVSPSGSAAGTSGTSLNQLFTMLSSQIKAAQTAQ